jgi:cytoskeletal protein RodZ
MTRTDVMASSRPQTEGAAKMGPGSTRRRLIVLPVVLLLLAVAAIAPMSAVAASTTTNKEGLSGYEKKSEEKSGTSPTTETKTPKTETTPTTTGTSTTPSSSTSPSSETATKATTLPFTGLDLRWMIGMGLLLAGAGVSIVTVQRRHRRDGR